MVLSIYLLEYENHRDFEQGNNLFFVESKQHRVSDFLKKSKLFTLLRKPKLLQPADLIILSSINVPRTLLGSLAQGPRARAFWKAARNVLTVLSTAEGGKHIRERREFN